MEGRLARLWVAALAVVLVALALAPPALADSEPLQPLSASTTDLIVAGIVVAVVAVAAWLCVYRIAEARPMRRRQPPHDEDSR